MIKQQMGSAIWRPRYWMQMDDTMTAKELSASANMWRNTPRRLSEEVAWLLLLLKPKCACSWKNKSPTKLTIRPRIEIVINESAYILAGAYRRSKLSL